MEEKENRYPVLFYIFLVLKLTEQIDWSWWWVFSPIIVKFVIEALKEIIEYNVKVN